MSPGAGIYLTAIYQNAVSGKQPAVVSYEKPTDGALRIVGTGPPTSATDEQKDQHDEDAQIIWDTNVGSAELAYILYQVPVLVAVHASRMLPDSGNA